MPVESSDFTGLIFGQGGALALRSEFGVPIALVQPIGRDMDGPWEPTPMKMIALYSVGDSRRKRSASCGRPQES